MRVQFVEKPNGPERLICEAELIFEEGGPLGGMKLVGFSLWRAADGEGVNVTFPSRAFGAGSERKFFDFLRPLAGDFNESRKVKAWILESYRQSRQAA